MSSCSCGHELNSDDRFCSRCGRSASIVDTSPLLLGQDRSDSIETSSEVRAGFPMRWVVVGVLAVGAMMWGLFAWPQAESTIGDDEAADVLDADDSAEDGTGEDRAADDGAEDDSAEQDGAEDDSAEDDSAEETVEDVDEEDSARSVTTGAEQSDSQNETVGPLVGELTGYGLAVGSSDFGALRVLSLDTGEELTISGSSGRPIAMVGTTLVTATWMTVFTVDLAAEDPRSERIFGQTAGWVDGVFVEDDLIWTFAGSGSGPDQSLIALTIDGEQVDSREVNRQFLFTGQSTETDLVTSDGGGVYVRSGSEFKRLSTGTLRAGGDELVLIDECDTRMRCEPIWYRRGDWERVELPSPPGPTFGWSSIEGGDRWLVSFDYQTNTMTLVEIATGAVVRNDLQYDYFGPLSFVSISPDGRWFFEPPASGSDGVIIDLDNGTEWPVDVAFRSDAAAQFIDLSGTVLDPG